MTEKIIASVTMRKLTDSHHYIKVTAQLVHLAGNARPYFSVTSQNGADHEAIARYFPELAPVIALHLADDQGTPMHAVDNGAYWLGLGDPRYVPEGAPHLDTFAKLWRLSTGDARKLYDYLSGDLNPYEGLRFLAKGAAARWQHEADEARALIESLAFDQAWDEAHREYAKRESEAGK